LFAGFVAPVWLATNAGFGVDQWNLSVKNFESLLLYAEDGQIIYGITILFIKLSILLQLLETFVPVGKNAMYWTCHLLIWLNIAVYVAITFAQIFICDPREREWDPFVPGTCINFLALNVASSSINSVSDLMLLILPQVIIWRLQMSLHHRLAISAIFLLGIL
jgi:hypothetical protein